MEEKNDLENSTVEKTTGSNKGLGTKIIAFFIAAIVGFVVSFVVIMLCVQFFVTPKKLRNEVEAGSYAVGYQLGALARPVAKIGWIRDWLVSKVGFEEHDDGTPWTTPVPEAYQKHAEIFKEKFANIGKDPKKSDRQLLWGYSKLVSEESFTSEELAYGIHLMNDLYHQAILKEGPPRVLQPLEFYSDKVEKDLTPLDISLLQRVRILSILAYFTCTVQANHTYGSKAQQECVAHAFDSDGVLKNDPNASRELSKPWMEIPFKLRRKLFEEISSKQSGLLITADAYVRIGGKRFISMYGGVDPNTFD